jgi:hypothetical protein
MGLSAIFPVWSVLMGHCAEEIAIMGLPAIFLMWGVLMGHSAE